MTSKRFRPVAWAVSKTLEKLERGYNNSPCILTDDRTELNDTPLYRDPEGVIAALEQRAKVLTHHLSEVTSVMITVLFNFHREDVTAVFSDKELKEVVNRSAHLLQERVENICRRAFDALNGAETVSSSGISQAAQLLEEAVKEINYPPQHYVGPAFDKIREAQGLLSGYLKPKPDGEMTEGWAVFRPDGSICRDLIALTEEIAQGKAEGYCGDEWFCLEQVGYTVRRVVIMEAQERGCQN